MSHRCRIIKATLTIIPISFLLLVLQGCKVGPDYKAPDYQMPDKWQESAIKSMEGNSNIESWWEVFNDPILNELISEARKENLNLKTAYTRLLESRAMLGVASGKKWPKVDAIGSYRNSEPSERGALKEVPGTDYDSTNLHSIGLDATWEIDLFGRISRSIESSQASLEASVEDYRDILVSLYSEVAQNYITLRALQSRIHYTQENIKLQEQMLKLIQDRRKVELVAELDVQQAKLVLSTTKSFLPRLRQLETESIHRLSVLLAKPPAALYEKLSKPVEIPKVPDIVTVSLPTELLRQRPDIRRAERNLAAETAKVGVATASLYPIFSLSGTFALEAQQIKGIGDTGDSHTWGIGPSMRWNIFDADRIRNYVKAQEARTQAALINYERTVLLALEEVENAMTAYAREQERLKSLQASVEAAKRSLALVKDSYDIGLTDFQNVLDMQRSLTQQEDQLAESRGLVAKNLARIYTSLGGGWSIDTPIIEEDSPKEATQKDNLVTAKNNNSNTINPVEEK